MKLDNTVGMIIKGKDLKTNGKKFFKVVNAKEQEKMHYHTGQNFDLTKDAANEWIGSGMSFTTVSNIFSLFTTSTVMVFEVLLDDEDDVFVAPKTYKAHSFTLGKPMKVTDINTYNYLIESGADVSLGWENWMEFIEVIMNTSNPKIIDLFLTDGMKNIYYWLVAAVKRKDVNLIQAVINHGANVHANHDGILKFCYDSRIIERYIKSVM